MTRGKSMKVKTRKVVFSAMVYLVWKERNERWHGGMEAGTPWGGLRW